MPRPSLKKERKEIILQAYERCIALYGVEGATQKRVSEEAGIARPLLRHHVGNNDDLLMEAVQRYVQRNLDAMQAFADYPFANNKELLDTLFFANDDLTSHTDTMIATGLLVKAQTDERIKEIMTDWLSVIQQGFETVLKRFHPRASEELIQIISTGLIGIYFNVDALFPIRKDQNLQTHSYKAAEKLLSVLSQDTGETS